jgi:hypothetical protein
MKLVSIREGELLLSRASNGVSAQYCSCQLLAEIFGQLGKKMSEGKEIKKLGTRNFNFISFVI